MPTVTTTNKSSPKFCLLLKTLLFLLCIYIKRVTAAQLDNCTALNANKTLVQSPKIVNEGEIAFDLNCSLREAIKINARVAPKHGINLKRLRNETMKRVKISWLKNDEILHRINGNPILDLLNADEKSLTLLRVGESDEGFYKCVLNYSNVPNEACEYFTLYHSIGFDLKVVKKSSIAPDTKPLISNPPERMMLSERGSNVTFSCNTINTLSHQTTFWFTSSKACSNKNQTCLDEFIKDYEEAKREQQVRHLDRYLITEYDPRYPLQELQLFNVSDKDTGFYGCFVENLRGFDSKLGRLELTDIFVESQIAKLPITTTTQPTIATNIKTDGGASEAAGYYATKQSIGSRGRTNSTSFNKDDQAIHRGTLPNFSGLITQASSGIFGNSQMWALAGMTGIVIISIIVVAFLVFWCLIRYGMICNGVKGKKLYQASLITPEPIVGITSSLEDKMRQHLPSGDCPDIYNIGKSTDGFITGLLQGQGTGRLTSQSICSNILGKEQNPSISSTNNSNPDEASSWGKSMSSNGDNCRAFYEYTSNTTTTTVPMYDHPPSTGKTQLCGAMVHDACVINPSYGYLRPASDDAINWAFPRRNLERLNKIGEGQFGEVWRYIARQKDGKESFVAVKQLKNRAGLGDRERLELIAEIEIMKLVNCHPNVIRLLNYCADDYEPILLIMEYAEHGKLQTYLRNCRSINRKSYGCNGSSCADSALSSFSSTSSYSSSSTSSSSSSSSSSQSSSSMITSKELIKFSYHIAKGMEYVASQGIVHRDLASRNILVSKDKVCKVADFGFARRVNDECAYERTTANPVPVKWMAPEALVENKFTSKSDVFSLGILMWEIVTLGATPYECLTSSEVYKKVTSGGRLERPAHCKGEFYLIMAKCWLHDPSQRPTFKELACELEQLLLSENDYIELDQYPEHAYYNILNTDEEKETTHRVK